MKQAQRKQPVVSVDNAPGEVIILPPVQVRRTTPTVTRWLRELTQRLLPPLLGLGVLLLAWQLAAMHSKGFPTPLSTLDSALTLFADPFYQDGPNDMGIGWNVLASLQRFKDSVKEVQAGYECGLSIEKFNDIKEGDIVEAFTMEQIEV